MKPRFTRFATSCKSCMGPLWTKFWWPLSAWEAMHGERNPGETTSGVALCQEDNLHSSCSLSQGNLSSELTLSNPDPQIGEMASRNLSYYPYSNYEASFNSTNLLGNYACFSSQTECFSLKTFCSTFLLPLHIQTIIIMFLWGLYLFICLLFLFWDLKCTLGQGCMAAKEFVKVLFTIEMNCIHLGSSKDLH
jgi:hypothetical protein